MEIQRPSVNPKRILLGASLYQFALLGTLGNSFSLFLAAMRNELSLSMTYISSFNTVKAVAGIFLASSAARLFFKKKKSAVMLAVILINVLGYSATVFANRPAVWYCCAFLVGTAFCTSAIMVPYVLKQHLSGLSGTATGIAMSFSGIGGIICNPLAAQLIKNIGWQKALLVLGAITVSITILALWLLFGKGGISETGGSEKKPDDAAAAEKTESGTAAKKPFRTKDFFRCCIIFFGNVVALQLLPHTGMLAVNLGYSLTTSAALNSCLMIGNVAGKFIFGAACDKIGVRRTVLAAYAMIICSACLFLLVPKSLPLMCVAMLLLGTEYALYIIGISGISIDAYGLEESKRYVGLHTMVNSALGAGIAWLIGVSFDAAGSFTPVLIAVILTGVCSSALVLFMKPHAEKA